MKILDHVQGSPEWWAARAGRPTGSEFSRIVTPATGKPAAAQDLYIAELIAESVGWRKAEFRGSPDIERGNYLESEARRWLAMEIGQDIHECGFCEADDGRYGSSPDGLILDGTPGRPAGIPVELKCPDLHTIIKWHMGGGLPRDHKVQCHAHMLVTGSDGCWFGAYADHESVPNLALWVPRDEFTAKLEEEVPRFCDRLAEEKAKIIDDPAYL